MRRILFLLLLAGLVSAATLETGTQIGASGGAGYYEVYMWQANYSVMDINSSNISFTGLDSNADVFDFTAGLICQDSTSCILDSVSSDRYVVIHDFISNTSAAKIINMTGNLTYMTVCYNNTGTGNLTLIMEDLDGDCNYGRFNFSTYHDNIKNVWFNRALTDFTECTVISQTNSTAQAGTCVRIYEDESVSETTLGTIISAIGFTISLISKSSQWDIKI